MCINGIQINTIQYNPYDYMDSFDRFEETELPSRADFLNKLSGDACSHVDYAHDMYGMHLTVKS